MDKYDLRSELVVRLRQGSYALNERSKPMKFRCPRHDDKTPSAWLGDHAWGCFACDFEESLNTLADILGVQHQTKRGFTVADYAERKQFNVAKLASWGVGDAVGNFGDDVVAIPYFDTDGKTVLRVKHRHAKGTYWAAPKGGGVFLYGLNKLAAHPDKPVVLVEGESDCHAGWHHGVLALGLPGAGMWRPEWKSHLGGRDVYLWKEPDKGGNKLVESVGRDLPNAKVITADSVKDLADLHKHLGAGFVAALNTRMAAAVPIGFVPPVVMFEPLLGPTLERLRDDKLKPVDAVPTMIPSWNRACRDAGGGVGLGRGWHVTVGANTGTGKSLVALNLAAEAMKHGERVGILSLEMSQAQLATRLLAIVTGVSVTELEQGQGFRFTSDRHAAQMMDELHERTGGVAFTNRQPLSRLRDVLSSMRYVHETHGCRYIITDYMQLARVEGTDDILKATQEVSGQVRNLARELNVVSVALSQFNRETSKNRDYPPTPQGLMGGSPLENDSDQVVLLDHSQYERNDTMGLAYTRMMLAKNRHGPQAIVPVRWDYRVLRLSEQASEAEKKVAGVESAESPVRKAKHAPEAAIAPEDRGEAWEPAVTEAV